MTSARRLLGSLSRGRVRSYLWPGGVGACACLVMALGSTPLPAEGGSNSESMKVSSSAADSSALVRFLQSNFVQRYINEHNDTFGGVYLDNGSPPLLIFEFTADADNRRSDLKGAAPWPAQVDIRLVKYTWAQLTQFTSRITSDLDRLRALGVLVEAVGPDVKRNLVAVQVADMSPQVQTEMQTEYPGLPWELESGGSPSPVRLGTGSFLGAGIALAIFIAIIAGGAALARRVAQSSNSGSRKPGRSPW
jgi:hypothetical protein